MSLFPLNDFNNDIINLKTTKNNNLSEKYSPELISEFEYEYNDISKYLNNNESFIIFGKKFCGKSTLIKFYLNNLNYTYTLFDDYTLCNEILINELGKLNTNVMSYFNNKKNVILFDNFDYFSQKIKDYILKLKKQFIIVSNSYLNKNLNYIYIQHPSTDYLQQLYSSIYFCETNKSPNIIQNINNFNELYSIIEINLYTKNNYITIYDIKHYDYNDYLFNDDLTFIDKINIINKLDDYASFQNSYILSIQNIDNLQKASDYISNSLLFTNTEYYGILNFLGAGYYIESKINKLPIKLIKKKKYDIDIPSNLF